MASASEPFDKPSAVPLVRMEDAAFRLGRNTVFENTDWEISPGRHWAVFGPNGAGKTTLVRGLCREITLCAGRIRYFFDSPKNGCPYEGRPYFVKNEIIRLSPETQHAMFGPFGGYHQARWQSFESKGVPTVAEWFVQHLDWPAASLHQHPALLQLGVSGLLEKQVLHLSNGEARRVALAAALMRRPHLLILDDPFCGLDAAGRAVFGEIIEGLLTAATPTIILITHRREEIGQDIEHGLFVKDMDIIRRGPIEHALAAAASEGRNNAPGAASADKASNATPAAFRKRQSAENTNPLIDMRRVTLRYQGRAVLSGIDWRVYPGQHWAVLGANGAGKSSLLSLILADNPQAYANEIYLFGYRRGAGESIWDIKQRIGWVAPELQGDFPKQASCFDVVCSGFYDTIGLYRTASAEQQQAAEAQLAAFDIPHLADRRMGDASTGEKRLVLLARALVKNPRLLVLDEPCQGLDADHRRDLVSRIDALCRNTAVTLIYVTHHRDELPPSITHVLKLEKGRLCSCGSWPPK